MQKPELQIHSYRVGKADRVAPQLSGKKGAIINRCKRKCYYIENSSRTKGQKKKAYAAAYLERDQELKSLK